MISRSYQYILDGTRIIYEKQQTVAQGGGATNILYYYYDESGVAGFELDGTKYYFLKNIQGDVVNILNSSGQVVVTYTYDAWGKVLSITGTLASSVGQINPFRYRSYYYDRETGFYYLQTRYYDPVVGRFLNSDSIIGANGGIQGYNMFAYCGNNPVIYNDPLGLMTTAIEVGNKYGYGSPEYVLAEHYETYYAKDNFDASPIIEGLLVRFSAEEVIRAVENINYQVTPQILEQYKDLGGTLPIPINDAVITKAVGVSVAIGTLEISCGIAVDDSGDASGFATVSFSNDFSFGVSAFYSTTYNSSVSGMSGPGSSVSASFEVPIGKYRYGYSASTDGSSITSTHKVGFSLGKPEPEIKVSWSYEYTIIF